ncbi:MAG: thioesterase domain-containing protein, partial [bacterium]|nr:thioesterase domain-containing protein [bacterium]
IVEYVLTDKVPRIKDKPLIKSVVPDKIWISNRKKQEDAQVRLFCFPYGGGGASIYRGWQQSFPDSIEVCPIQLPGRENRMEEKPLDNINTLVELLAYHLNPKFNLPFAFFGHSFGSLVAFELTRYLRRNNLPQPVQLFTSAYPDPRMPSNSLNNLLVSLNKMDLNLFDLTEELMQQLSDKQLRDLSSVFQENGIVDYSDERMNQSIVKVLLPIFVGDMKIVKNYRYYEEPALKIPLTVFLGAQDNWVSSEDMMGWADHSLIRCDFTEFDSGHLFIREKEIREQVIHKIALHLRRFTAEVCDN